MSIRAQKVTCGAPKGAEHVLRCYATVNEAQFNIEAWSHAFDTL